MAHHRPSEESVGMETVTMAEAEGVLKEWFDAHDGHDGMWVDPGRWQVAMWCEACKEYRSFKIDEFRAEVGRTLMRDGAVTF